MKKGKEKLKSLLIFLLGGLITSSVVYVATLYSATEVSYDNSSSGTSNTNVQTAIDELYEKTFSFIGNSKCENAAAPYQNKWYSDYSTFVNASGPWFDRGGGFNYGILSGQFYFKNYGGGSIGDIGSRMVLSPK